MKKYEYNGVVYCENCRKGRVYYEVTAMWTAETISKFTCLVPSATWEDALNGDRWSRARVCDIVEREIMGD